jgi:sn-glycerol 3-phosphate transport system ATP-binding protein
MNEGRIEQIGTPFEVYHTPATTFVASFMGAPPMNLLPGIIRDGQVMLDGQQICQTSHTGTVTIGIRPEDFIVDPTGGVSVDIELVEELGAHRLLHGTLAGELVTVHVSNQSIVTPGPYRLSVKPKAVRLFDQMQGHRL